MSIISFNNECHCQLSLGGTYFQDLSLGSNPIFKNLCLLKIEVNIFNLIQETLTREEKNG